MTEQDEDQAIEQGHVCAMAALTAQKEHLASLRPDERLYWWFGFITAAMGAALASIGEPAVRALRAALDDDNDTLRVTRRGRNVGGDPSLRKKRTHIRELLPQGKKKA
jgi:hypothetical protein